MKVNSKSANDEIDIFLVEGVLSELRITSGVENFLAEIDLRYKALAEISGVGAALSELPGQAASAASIGMYGGEDSQLFVGLIGRRVVCGGFGGAEWLRNGHHVKMVVEQKGEILLARGIVDASTGLLWIGYSKGTGAELKSNARSAGGAYVFTLVLFNIAYILSATKRMSYLELMLYAAAGGALLLIGMTLWVCRDLSGLTGPTTAVYRLLGFAQPEDVDLSAYRVSLGADNDYLDEHGFRAPDNMVDGLEQVRNVYLYKRAIADGRLRQVDH